MTLSRRAMLQLTTLASAHAVFGESVRTRGLAFPTEPRRRLAVATYPFRAMLIAPSNTERLASVPGMDLAAFARYLREEFNVYGIEPLHAHFPSTEPAEIHKLRVAFDRADMRTVNIPVDEEVDLCSPDPALRQAGYAIYRKWVDIAVMLGSPSIRIGVPGCGGANDIAGPVKALLPIVDYAAQRKVIVNLENDDPVLGNAARVVAVLRAANNPGLCALPDFGNSMMSGNETFNAAAVQSMFGFAINVAHVKDAELIKGVRHTASLSALFAIAKHAGYRGYFSMESDSNADPVPDTRHLIDQSLALM